MVAQGEALPSRLELELPESERKKLEAQEDPATKSEPLEEQPTPGPQVLSYFFGDWEAHAGRLLPLYIDEFHGEVTPDTDPRRAIDVKRFLWSVPAEIKTWRGDGQAATEARKPPVESRD